ncbi:tRNA-dihydrouridine(20) synthase [NAD(P)+]-like isoform X2 [Orussus abietinus]|uniref:tRNA-dihydrouridine(20) synthase [NAD(P)+]-like isoform X2 n=1 Tax=Orussus abietinus TaxID=222816 RepID=UPI000625A71E|nr:tRNA-dihydrouridine(20) synthase [NAD(P)+]-like isoform X2 [Orussus abietinus]
MSNEEKCSTELSYRDKIIMAPMVRIGTLPMRLLALDYGADIVYTEELIDWKLLRSIRRENEKLQTIDYVDRTDGTVVFRTCAREKNHVVLQIGTSDAGRALQVAKMVHNDVAGIDVNMGCPKRFSLTGGMGAALLKQPEKAKGILKTLVEGSKVPISCKIRVLPTVEETLALCEILISAGISAIAVHGRTTEERPQHPNRIETLRKIAEKLRIPVIANGGSRDIETHKDILKFKEESGCSSVMIARAAEWNCSIFKKDGVLPMEQVIKDYLKCAVDYDNPPSNTKYCVQNILRDLQETPKGRRFLDALTLQQIWMKEKEYQANGGLLGRYNLLITADETEGGKSTKRKYEDEDVTSINCAFLKNSYSSDAELPKTRLSAWAWRHKKEVPSYKTWKEEKLFRSVVCVDGRKYGSSLWEKNKKRAEQSAALACLYSLGLIRTDNSGETGKVIT